jgi:hypothetical protein
LNSHSATVFFHFLILSHFQTGNGAPRNNKFRYAYINIADNDLDLTPPDDQLELMDAYMLDHQLLNFMQQVLEGTDQSFYRNNTDIANDFFAGPAYAQFAIDALGYPGNNAKN